MKAANHFGEFFLQIWLFFSFLAWNWKFLKV